MPTPAPRTARPRHACDGSDPASKRSPIHRAPASKPSPGTPSRLTVAQNRVSRDSTETVRVKAGLVGAGYPEIRSLLGRRNDGAGHSAVRRTGGERSGRSGEHVSALRAMVRTSAARMARHARGRPAPAPRKIDCSIRVIQKIYLILISDCHNIGSSVCKLSFSA